MEKSPSTYIVCVWKEKARWRPQKEKHIYCVLIIRCFIDFPTIDNRLLKAFQCFSRAALDLFTPQPRLHTIIPLILVIIYSFSFPTVPIFKFTPE
jgi:hypothetical protein